MNKRKLIAEILAAILLMSIILYCYNRIITPKYMYGSSFPTSQTYIDFYNLEKDSIDVLFLGSSHATCAFSPAELYDKYQIKSYNLSCEEQNLITSYYWLKESLKTQSPQVVVLDCYMLYLFDKESLLNSRTICTRKAFDYMRWSGNKIEAINDLSFLGEAMEMKTFIFPALVYHDNWKTPSLNNFEIFSRNEASMFKGYLSLEAYGGIDFAPVSLSAFDDEAEEPNEIMLEYLERIIKLCEEEDIRLILTSTPTMFEDVNQAAYLNKLAAQYDIEFYDYNTAEIYNEIGYDFALDNHDEDHANLTGSIKITDHLAGKMLNNPSFVLSSGKNELWEKYADEYKAYLNETEVESIFGN